MKLSSLRRLTVGLLAACALSVAAPTLVMAEVTDADVVEKVAVAQSSADHLEIAAYYRKLADQAAGQAQMHQNMRARLTSTGKSSGNAWNAHCGKLIAAYKSAESEALAMAKEHEALAKAAK